MNPDNGAYTRLTPLNLSAVAARCELCEYNPKVLEVANRFLREPLAMKGTEYVVPRGPGLGVEIVRAGEIILQ
jgi:L-alanine-DL-glutamate epimerase-like enolase superfamily enzyme